MSRTSEFATTTTDEDLLPNPHPDAILQHVFMAPLYLSKNALARARYAGWTSWSTHSSGRNAWHAGKLSLKTSLIRPLPPRSRCIRWGGGRGVNARLYSFHFRGCQMLSHKLRKLFDIWLTTKNSISYQNAI